MEMDLRNKTLIMDRGFFSAEVLKFLAAHELRFLMPAWRSSNLYKVRVHLTTPFEYQERIIRSGRRKQGNTWLYLFQDLRMEAEEKSTAYRKFLEKRITREELDEDVQLAGNILLVSNIDDTPENIYKLYKQRDAVEKLFDTYKTVLHADRSYLQDDEAVFGHVFVSFLSLYAYTGLEQRIREAGLTARLSPLDVIETFRKVYRIEQGRESYLTEITKKVADLDKALGTGLFPKPPS
jgi:transposase